MPQRIIGKHRRSYAVKLMEKVAITPGGCWNWVGYVEPNGYGYFRHEQTRWAHRASWLIFCGPIPEGLELDHLCRNKRCVNPDHLEPVTGSVNQQRAKPWTKCKDLHPGQPPRWAERSDGRTFCRECGRRREIERRAKFAEKQAASGLRAAPGA